MFRCNESIRLTALDRQLFQRLVGAGAALPTTVDAYNQQLAQAAGQWGCGHSDGERQLARMARALMLDPLDPADVLGGRPLG